MKRYLLLTLTLSLAALWLLPFHASNEYTNVFHSSIYSSYREQLSQVASPENSHREFVQKLRKNVDSQVAGWIFRGADLGSEMRELLARHVELPHGEMVSYIEEAFHKLKLKLNEPVYLSWTDDPYLLGNLPAHVFTLENTRVVRMGKPTIGDQLSPEFAAFIGGGEKHLYINLLKRQGREGKVSRTLEQLNTITLSKDSAFYKQRDKLELDKETFKQALLTELQGENYYWSDNLDRWNKELVNQVGERYFAKREKLSSTERQDYIELFYIALLDRLVLELKPTSMNISCHHGMDRGPSLLALWMYAHGQKEEAATLLLAAPLMIHNRAPHTSRIHRFLSAAKRLEMP